MLPLGIPQMSEVLKLLDWTPRLSPVLHGLLLRFWLDCLVGQDDVWSLVGLDFVFSANRWSSLIILTLREREKLPGVMCGSSSTFLDMPCHGLPGTNSGMAGIESRTELPPSEDDTAVEFRDSASDVMLDEPDVEFGVLEFGQFWEPDTEVGVLDQVVSPPSCDRPSSSKRRKFGCELELGLEPTVLFRVPESLSLPSVLWAVVVVCVELVGAPDTESSA